MLVDGLELEPRAKTENLLEEMNEARKILPEARRDWMKGYAWRVLGVYLEFRE